MSRTPWSEIRRELGSRRAPPPARDAESFWREFRARALRTPAAESVARPFRRLRLVLAGAAIPVAAAAVWLLLLFAPRGLADSTQVKSLEVIAPHSAVFIIEVSEAGGLPAAILWISGVPDEESPHT